MYTTVKPKRLWSGKHRLAKRILCSDKRFLFAYSLNVGDLISVCRGYNAVINTIYYYWYNEGEQLRNRRNRTWYLQDIDIITVGGLSCGMECISLPKSKDEIMARLINWFNPNNEWIDWNDNRAKFRDALLSGVSVLDDRGCLAEEFVELAYGRTIAT